MAEPESQDREVFDVHRIRQLVELMKEHELSEVDLRQADQRIRLSRGPRGEVRAYAPAPLQMAPMAPSEAAATPPPATVAESSANIIVIKSPMVGTFYGRPNPKAESYVKVGDHVEPETTVCIIEAMKVFNEIPAEVRGKIVAILVDDDQPVDFGKPLFKVDTSQ
jgi:acetyl-CoA carboxylase biotin carboxyl carrier protein